MKNRVSGLAASLLLAISHSAFADYKLNLQTPVNDLAREVYSLHTFLLVICTVIFVVVFAVMFYSIFKHRKSKGHKAANFHESTTVEIIWTIIPVVILVAMAWPATKVIIAQKDTRGTDMTIKVTGYQWKWGYDYLDEGISFHSRLKTPQDQYENFAGEKPQRNDNYLLEVDNPVVVPVGKRIRVLLTANDVIHSWWVPAFSVKQDAIPGFIRDTWFQADKEGIYRGQCVELCGKDHGFMPIVVHVVSQGKYDAWVTEQKKLAAASQDDPNKTWVLADLKARGEKVYQANCAVCHQASGKGQGAFPALDGSKMVTGPKADQINLVINGKNAMPAWGKTLSDTEIAAAITYTRNTWGNSTGEVLQPAEIKAARK
ncbi:cytochrome c oxidase subunit II [Chitinimonas sp. BJB300]|uniref:cytochrome c oxidase subunit II n=1 Tax=Chitinimonas sp. BJB300 TaxID=1559339 RepID=UPI000C112655|nr:cytochrome c oxidase subunit II [Chitinimonas sp. BJB300]PHV11608.1 cytochrome c oxidase subunit II [Chitinimonas sp. BJB300]TSJ88096.1 cytochrome c oxidase subunit II [Chitinimonas sp. BJB300]